MEIGAYATSLVYTDGRVVIAYDMTVTHSEMVDLDHPSVDVVFNRFGVSFP